MSDCRDCLARSSLNDCSVGDVLRRSNGLCAILGTEVLALTVDEELSEEYDLTLSEVRAVYHELSEIMEGASCPCNLVGLCSQSPSVSWKKTQSEQ